MNYKFSSIQKPRVFFQNFEMCRPDNEPNMDEHLRNLSRFEEGNKEGEVLNAFGKMLGNFITGKGLTTPQQQTAEKGKNDTIRQASIILNNRDPKFDTESKINELIDLFQSFQKNKDAFPQNIEITQGGKDSREYNSEKFLSDLMRVIGDNRKLAEGKNQLLAMRFQNIDIPPARAGNTKLLNTECMDAFDEVGML